MRPIRSVLVANRGEIAVRVIRACRELGLRSIAVYSDADRHSLPVRLADEAYHLGPSPPAESYLHIGRLIEIAHRAGADAVHPGYGFLAENADFAEACLAAGLRFVGPRPETMRALGRKTDARRTVRAVGVPTVPGTLEPVRSLAEVEAIAAEVGFPLALKAVAGGGGRGMRRVDAPAALADALRAAQNEAAAAFGDGAVYVERLVERPRHVEVQILADAHGQVIALGERDCSVQRRYQKLIEETPAPGITPAQRAALWEAAVRAARAADYVNAGTVEFLLAPDGQFYFLEVNARLQVEHPVTELCTGIDLVHAQLAVAAGEPLPWRQEDIQPRGAAIECRLLAEDAAAGFVPATGRLATVRLPSGPGVRVDAGYETGDEVTPYYDSLLAKLCVWGVDREHALARARRALAECVLLGVPTTLGFHRYALAHPEFVSATHDTGFVARHWPPPAGEGVNEQEAAWLAIGAALAAWEAQQAPRTDDRSREEWAARARQAALRGAWR
ncbi:MAG: ATP-grasp domain-containing protein [Chloroflexi bacterium]|nr:ATP-grasp domain-containing protein [Chloroflexota bacterium]